MMRRTSIKYVFMLLIPLFLLAFSPMSRIFCERGMTACSDCCDQVTQHNISSPELAFQDLCCVIYSSQSPTAMNVASRDINDFSKIQLQTKPLATNSLSLNLSISSPIDKISSEGFYLPYFPLFLSKQSFLL